MKRIIIILAAAQVFLTLHAAGQTKNSLGDTLLFIVESTDIAPNQQFLVPTIENILKRLPDAEHIGQHFFSHVNSINRIFDEQNKIRTTLKKFNTDFENTRSILFSSDDRDSVFTSYINLLAQYKTILFIKINPTSNGLLEYQFFRYKKSKDLIIVQDDSIKTFDLPFDIYTGSSSVFVNPAAPRKDQIDLLTKALIQIFPEVNQAPKGFITAEKELVGDTLYFAVGDPIKLIAKISDIDSREEFFSYEWRILQPSHPEINIELKYNHPIQSFSLHAPTQFSIGMRVNDGIKYSEVDTLHIKIMHKPRLQLYNSRYSSLISSTTISTNSYLFHSKRTYSSLTRFTFGQVEGVQSDFIELSLIPHDLEEKMELTKHIGFVDLSSIPLKVPPQALYPHFDKQELLNVHRLMSEKITDDFTPYTSIAFYHVDSSQTPPNFVFSLLPGGRTRRIAAGTYQFKISVKSNSVESAPIDFQTKIVHKTPLSMGYTLYFYLKKNNFYYANMAQSKAEFFGRLALVNTQNLGEFFANTFEMELSLKASYTIPLSTDPDENFEGVWGLGPGIRVGVNNSTLNPIKVWISLDAEVLWINPRQLLNPAEFRGSPTRGMASLEFENDNKYMIAAVFGIESFSSKDTDQKNSNLPFIGFRGSVNL